MLKFSLRATRIHEEERMFRGLYAVIADDRGYKLFRIYGDVDAETLKKRLELLSEDATKPLS